MTVNITRPIAFGVAAVLLVVTAVLVAVHRHGQVTVVAVAPLSSTDRHVLISSRSLIDSLPAALGEVPIAAADAAGGRITVAQARATLRRTATLHALSDAVAEPSVVIAPLRAAYDAVVAGRSPGSVDQLVPALQALQTVEGQVVPAIRLIAAHSGTPPTAAAALTAIEGDHKVVALAQLVGGWQQVYGAFTLVEQQAAGS